MLNDKTDPQAWCSKHKIKTTEEATENENGDQELRSKTECHTNNRKGKKYI